MSNGIFRRALHKFRISLLEAKRIAVMLRLQIIVHTEIILALPAERDEIEYAEIRKDDN
ncbi:MAG TPA: hypothetical protein PL048_04800 [Leptospiraceae bacterium]|nr:hypothetical protein [Leptospiraceae bacterium]HMZ58067.1 hypothetical protein [Leptospiraceae bacterium]HNF14561.1 hypothetical protein [Leptospiraceae bacterium]HNF25156.1 hypothetical protein [Leptospiraceae bacterium]HNI28619.1 hypothetical protein [Leptospiraceae bacterium]